jgi:glycosyltransferase involved in cell wall biosynthesis
MRIVLVTGIYPPDHGGPAKFIPLLARHMTELGWSVTVVTLSDDPAVTDESSWHVVRLPRNTAKWRRIPSTVAAITTHLRHADVMFANGLFEEAAVAARIARRPWVAKFVGDPVWERRHNQRPDGPDLEQFNSSPLKGRAALERRVLSAALRSARIAVTPSQQLSALLQGWGVARTEVVPNGVQIEPLSGAEPSVDVITVARLVHLKRIDSLIAACAAAECSLDIVGDGPQREQLHVLVNSLAPMRPVRLLGSLSADQVSSAMDRAKVFALLSSHEGMSFALLEAMSRAKAVVVGDNEGNRGVVSNGHNGVVVPGEDVNVVANVLSELVENPSRRTALGAAARQTVEQHYNIDSALTRTVEQIVSAAGGHA